MDQGERRHCLAWITLWPCVLSLSASTTTAIAGNSLSHGATGATAAPAGEAGCCEKEWG